MQVDSLPQPPKVMLKRQRMQILTLNAGDDGELALLERAANYADCGDLIDLSDEAIRQVTRREGVDFATALLFDRVVRSTDHGPSIARLQALGERAAAVPLASDVLFAIVPGAFHTEYPETGADGAAIRAAAEQMGCRTEFVPLPTMGLPTENARHLGKWLHSRPAGERIVLISLSKGGTDVKAALATADCRQAFDRVIAWVSVSGVIDGVPIVNWGLSRPHTRAIWRALFWCRGWSFQFVQAMKFKATTTRASDLRLPDHMRLIHVVGFPLQRHVGRGYPRRWFRRLATNGPNDSVTMLLDVCRLPGVVFPIWGSDHYLAPHGPTPFVQAIVHYLADECGLLCEQREVQGTPVE